MSLSRREWMSIAAMVATGSTAVGAAAQTKDVSSGPLARCSSESQGPNRLRQLSKQLCSEPGAELGHSG
jgi:hypothetical protein